MLTAYLADQMIGMLVYLPYQCHPEEVWIYLVLTAAVLSAIPLQLFFEIECKHLVT